MGNLTYDGNVRLFLVDTIADIDAPTVAEIGAGTEITTSVPKDGWSVQNAPSKVDTGNLSTLWNADDRFREAYLDRYDGYYLTGDAGYKSDFVLFSHGILFPSNSR